MNASRQVTRRSVLAGAGALTIAGALGSSMTSAATPSNVWRNSSDIQNRFQALRAGQQLQVRRGADWWGKNLDLTVPSRTHDALASLVLNELNAATRDSVLSACSLVLVGLVRGMRGTNNSVSALWISGLSKEGVGPWHRA